MKLVAMTPLRNEAWVAGFSVRATLMWADAVVAINHASTDETRDILSDIAREHPGRLLWEDVPSNSWAEMDHRQKMLETARGEGATHVAIVDADEIACGSTIGEMRRLISETPAWNILQLPIYNMRGSIERYHKTGIWGNRTVSVAFADQPQFNWQGDQFHHREPFGVPELQHQPLRQGAGGIMHLWGVTERRLIAKHQTYKLTERLRWPEKSAAKIDAYYNWAIYESASVMQYGEWEFSKTPAEWLDPYRDLMDRYYRPESTPWQEAYARELYRQSPERFEGLDLFGLS